jgi:hypothetical protein
MPSWSEATLAAMPSLAAYPGMRRRDRERLGLRECRAAWLVGVTVREYRELEASHPPSADVYEGICDLFGWPTARSIHVTGRRKDARVRPGR